MAIICIVVFIVFVILIALILKSEEIDEWLGM